MHFRNVTRSILAVAVVAAIAAPLVAQEFGEIAEQFRRNGEAMRNYSWKSKVDFEIDGEVRSTQLFGVSFDDEGRIHREPIETDGKYTKQQDIAETTLINIRNLIDGYVHMSPEAFKAAFGDNPRSIRAGTGEEPTRIRASNVIARGDVMEVRVDPDTHRVLKLTLDTVLQKSAVHVVADFQEAEGGLSYSYRTVLTMQHKKKDLRIVHENFDLKPR